MGSPLDRQSFNRTLLFPRRDASPPPAGAEDRFVDVPGARLHLRLHPALGAGATVLLFHGNGEVVADYDDQALAFAGAGAGRGHNDVARASGYWSALQAFVARVAPPAPARASTGPRT